MHHAEKSIRVRDALNLGRKRIEGRLIVGYQTKGVAWLLDREIEGDGKFICADQMGLGKTIQTITMMQGNPLKKPTLIVVPNALVAQWVQAFKQFTRDVKTTILFVKGIKTYDTKTIDTSSVYITTYSMFQIGGSTRKVDSLVAETRHPLQAVEWGRIILDEAHIIKNQKTKVFKQLNSLNSDNRGCLTGTPIMGDTKDFVSLLMFLRVRVNPKPFDDELRKLRNIYVLRRTKEDVARQNERLRLPPLKIETCVLPFAYPEEDELYQRVFEKTQQKMSAMETKNPIKILELLLRLRQICIVPQLYLDGVNKKMDGDEERTWEGSSTKLDALLKDIKEVKKEKCLVFSQFTLEMKMIQEHLGNNGIRALVLSGSQDSDEKDKCIRRWKRTDKYQVLIIQIAVGSCGLNLQEATRVFFMGPSWVPAVEDQAIARAHRTNQTQVVYVKRYIIEGSFEEKILELQEKKIEITSKTLGDPRIMKMLVGDQ